ncbi:MAG: hypothetical protein CAK90_00685 [Spartobacteria bacterium AMD-G4]|nr:MAG: hypothetical protein CAK90_00685 [Spartobacteria bacterium AMD-G4]
MLTCLGAVVTEDRTAFSNPCAKPFHWGGAPKKCPKNNSRFRRVVFCPVIRSVRLRIFEKSAEPPRMRFRTRSSMASCTKP